MVVCLTDHVRTKEGNMGFDRGKNERKNVGGASVTV